MSLVVQKFGGTSVATAEKILSAAQIAVNAHKKGSHVVMVVSARGHKTDELIELAKEVSDTPPAREMDMLLSTGEQESVALTAMAVQKLGVKAISMTGGQMGIRTDSSFTKARIKSINIDRMRHALDGGAIVIAAGFQGIDDDFNITTLGRGGSDTTAVALAAVLEADVCEIYTDVDGIYTTDPRAVKDARRIPRISYEEMLELTSLGGGKMHSRSIEFAKKYRVPILVRPSYKDDAGTLITSASQAESRVVTAVALARNEARVSLLGIPDRPGVISAIFTQMAARKTPIDMVVQNISSHGVTDVSFTVPESDLAETLTAAHAAVKELGAGVVQHGTNLSKVSIVGSGMVNHPGVASRLFSELSAAGVNILMITTSDIKISVLVDRSQGELALVTAHRGFALEQEQPTVPLPGSNGGAVSPPKSDPEREAYEASVVDRLASMEDILVSEVQLDRTQGLVTLRNVPDQPGLAAEIFSAVAHAGVLVDLIVQNSSQDGRATVSFTTPATQVELARSALRPVVVHWPGVELSSDASIAILSVLGVGLRTHTGVGERMFKAIAAAGVNVRLISTSEIRMGVIVEASAGESAHQALLATFELAANGR